MSNVRRIYVEKKAPFAVKARELHEELKNYLDIDAENVRVFIRYDVENISDEVFARACKTVFSEPPVDELYEENIAVPANGKVFSVEFLPGQFDQRADSAVQCIKFLNENEDNHVLYRVTPIFDNDNLLATGVQLEIMSVEDFNDMDVVIFENEKFSAFKSFKKYLTNRYGNYMELPPVEKRGIQHNFTAYMRDDK